MSANQIPSWVESGQARQSFGERALTVAGAGSVLLQTYVNRVVTALTLREHGALSILPRRPGQGNAAIVNRRAPGTTSLSQSEAWVSDTAEPNEDQGVYTQATFTYKTATARGKVTRKLQATGKSYADVLATEISGRADDFSDILEVALFQGNSAALATQIDGFLTMINAIAGQVVANTTSNSGDALALSQLDKAIDVIKGSANRSELVIFANHRGRRILNSALQANQQFNDKTVIEAGFRVRTYDDIPIVTTTGIPDTLALSTNGSFITTFTGGSTTALVIVNTRYVWIEELTPTQVLPLAKKSSQYDEFDMYWDGVLVIHNTKGVSLLTALQG